MKKELDSFRERLNRGNEPALTTKQLNAAVRELKYLPSMLLDELMVRVSEEEMAQMEPYLADLRSVFFNHVGQCLYNPSASNPHPETLTDLRERFVDGEEKLINFLQSHGVQLNDGAQAAFQATYRQLCHRVENVMMGKTIGAQAGQYLLQ